MQLVSLDQLRSRGKTASSKVLSAGPNLCDGYFIDFVGTRFFEPTSDGSLPVLVGYDRLSKKEH